MPKSRQRELQTDARETMRAEIKNRLADIAQLNLTANDVIKQNPGADVGDVLSKYIKDENVFDKQTGVLALISSRPPAEGPGEDIEGFAPKSVIPTLSTSATSLEAVQRTLKVSRASKEPTLSGRLKLDGTGLDETLGGKPRVFLLTTPIYENDVLVRNITSAVWGDMLVTAVLRDAPEFTEVTLRFEGKGIGEPDVGLTLSSTQKYVDDASTLHVSIPLLGITVKSDFKATYTVESPEVQRLRDELLYAGIIISILIAGLLLATRQSRIRAHRQVLEALSQVSESEARFRGAFEAAPIGMFLANADGIILQANLALAELASASPSSLLGQTVGDLVLHQDRTEMIEAFEHALSPHRPTVDPFVVHLAAPSARRSTATVLSPPFPSLMRNGPS